MEKKGSREIKILGWLLIAYFFYLVLSPIIPIVPKNEMYGDPAFVSALFNPQGLSEFFLSVLFLIAICIGGICEILGSLVGGIAVLRLKRWSRGFVVAIFLINIISKIIRLAIASTSLNLTRYLLGSRVQVFYFCLYLALDILIIYFFTRPKVKEQFI